jgi:ribosomal protein S24E
MKMEVAGENENKLLHRKELNIVLTDIKTTPSKKDILAHISANLGASEAVMVLGSVYQDYGRKEAKCSVKVYESEEWKKKIEPKPKEKKDKAEGEKK